MTVPLFHVDAFTDRPFAGNPAAVCVLEEPMPDQWLQSVAEEMNLSETAFVLKHPGGYPLRWFTPKAEVDLCGHATLASAHVLWEQGIAKRGEAIAFATRSGLLKASLAGDEIELDFPFEADEPAAPPPALVEGLGVPFLHVGRNRFDYLVELDSQETLQGLQPDFRLLASIPCRGIIVTSRSSDSRFDFVSRFFAPALGVDEDPVCGSAHCCLGPFWRKRLGKTRLLAYQASPRGGVVRVRLEGERVFLGGKAITVARGELLA